MTRGFAASAPIGYPRLGYLARADVSRAAQLWPGDEVTFQPIAAAEAVRALDCAEARLHGIVQSATS